MIGGFPIGAAQVASDWNPVRGEVGVTFGEDLPVYAVFGEVTSGGDGIVSGETSEAGTTFGEAF